MAQAPVASMPAAPSMAGVVQNTNGQTDQALDAMARGGKAGLDAYNAAQTQGQGYRQQVLGSILNSNGIGDDAKSALSAQVEASLAPRLTDMAQGQANLQGDLARGQQQYQKYGAEANAAVPVIQAQQQQTMSVRDQALQLAQQQIDADAKAKALQNQHDQTMAGLQLQAQQAQTAQAQAARDAAMAKAAGGTPVTATQAANVTKGTQSIGGAYAQPTLPGGTVGPNGRTGGGIAGPRPAGRTDVTDEMMMDATDNAVFNHDDVTTELAKIVASTYGLTPQQASQVITPSLVSSMQQSKPMNPPPPPDVKAAAAALGGNVGDANAVVNGSQWGRVVGMVNSFATAPLDPATGKIAGTPGVGSAGLTPWEAYSQWVTQNGNLAPGDTKTLQVLTKTYKPFLDAIAGT